MPNRKSLLDWIFPNKSIASSIPSENIPCINLFRHVIQTCVISVRYYGVAHALELLHVVHHLRSEVMALLMLLNFSMSFTTFDPKKVVPSSSVGSYIITVAPFAFTRFITPCMELWRKLSLFDFIVSLYTPTTHSFSSFEL